MDKYRPCPSIIAMFTSDSQHPPRSKHAVYLGDGRENKFVEKTGLTVFLPVMALVICSLVGFLVNNMDCSLIIVFCLNFGDLLIGVHILL